MLKKLFIYLYFSLFGISFIFAQTTTISGFQLTFNASGGYSQISSSLYELSSNVPFPTSSDYLLKQVNYVSTLDYNGETPILKIVNPNDLSDVFCAGTTCSFTYDYAWLSSSSNIIYKYCNSFGGCSRDILIPFILKNSSDIITSGIHFTGIIDFNGTVIIQPQPQTQQSSSVSLTSLPSTSFISIFLTFIIILLSLL
ncbi:MAG: hypothetical protein HRU03_02940 [Nanoarchaeales archaeon]|nr:hypothetical protein [Nanoarchaeales archaeon]